MPISTYNAVTWIAWLLISTGCGWIYPPAGLIVAGVGLVAGVLLTLWLARLGAFLQPKKGD
jgi:hypothetical protein